MRTVGILGGMSWESSVEYERLINEGVRERLGGTSAADLIIRSYDFAQIERLQAAGEWDALHSLLASDATLLEAAGADAIAIATNTMHLSAPAIEERITIPLLHIADATADAIETDGLDSVALLGTRYTMEKDFYRASLEARGLSVAIPEEPGRTAVHDVIYDELVRGVIRDDSRSRFLGIISDLVDSGSQGVIAGCTEIELLVKPQDVDVPYFPTTTLHAAAIVDFILT